MLTATQRDAWILDHGPWLYWTLATSWQWPWILRDGIQPSARTGRVGVTVDMVSRPGHIYFMTDCIPAARIVAQASGEPDARVDIRMLDLARFATDEDRLDAGRPLANHDGPVKQLPRWAELPERPHGTSVGEWMNEQSSIVDQAEWVWHSMVGLTVAYRGGVEAAMLEFLPRYLSLDWEPACPPDECVEHPRTSPRSHFIGGRTA